MPASQRVLCFVLLSCQVLCATSVRLESVGRDGYELVTEESSIEESRVSDKATSMSAAAQHHDDIRSGDNESLTTDGDEVIHASLSSDEEVNLATHGGRPNKGAVCCQRRGVPDKCCSASQVSSRDIRNCEYKDGNPCGRKKRVEFWYVVWQYNQDGSSASCTDMTAKRLGNWWGTWGFGSTKYCEDPVHASTEKAMYRLMPDIELTNAAPGAARCCWCHDDCINSCVTSHYRKNGDCTYFCKRRGGLDSSDPVPRTNGSHREACH